MTPCAARCCAAVPAACRLRAPCAVSRLLSASPRCRPLAPPRAMGDARGASASASACEHLFALDFDGVVCDSVGESAVSAWRAAAAEWPGEFSSASGADRERVLQGLRAVRPVVETGYENLLLARLLLERAAEPEAILAGESSAPLPLSPFFRSPSRCRRQPARRARPRLHPPFHPTRMGAAARRGHGALRSGPWAPGGALRQVRVRPLAPSQSAFPSVAPRIHRGQGPGFIPSFSSRVPARIAFFPAPQG